MRAGAETRVAVRRAGADDEGALGALFGEVPMAGQLVLATRREPRFFHLYQMQRGSYDTFVVDAGPPGQLAGMASVLVRQGYHRGVVCPLGYLGDLRISGRAGRLRLLPRLYGQTLAEVVARHHVRHLLTAILASNQAAMQALVRRRGARAAQPRYQLFRRFEMVSVQFTGRRPTPSNREVRVATPADVPALSRFLHDDHRQRPFGYRFDDGELAHRLAHWPGFSLDRTYLVLDGARLVGCATAWDAAEVKRYQVLAYRGGMAWTKRFYNTGARLLGWPRLPEPGGAFRYLYLTNLSIAGDDPAVLRALLARVYADFRGGGYHFFSLPIYEDDPLGAAVAGYTTRRLGFHLYTVSEADAPDETELAGRPGFEMALA